MKQQGVQSSNRSSLLGREMSNDADQMDRKFGQFVIPRHQEFADVAIIAVCADKDSALRERTILKMCSNSTIDFLHTGELLAVLNVQAISENVAQLLTVKSESSFGGRDLEACFATIVSATLMITNHKRAPYHVSAFKNKKFPSSFFRDESTTALAPLAQTRLLYIAHIPLTVLQPAFPPWSVPKHLGTNVMSKPIRACAFLQQVSILDESVIQVTYHPRLSRRPCMECHFRDILGQL